MNTYATLTELHNQICTATALHLPLVPGLFSGLAWHWQSKNMYFNLNRSLTVNNNMLTVNYYGMIYNTLFQNI